jgi:hypothetical protein
VPKRQAISVANVDTSTLDVAGNQAIASISVDGKRVGYCIDNLLINK